MAGEPAPAKAQTFTCRIWICNVEEHSGLVAGHISGTVTWDEAGGVITIKTKPLEKPLFWVPGTRPKEKGIAPNLGAFDGYDITLRKGADGLWKTEEGPPTIAESDLIKLDHDKATPFLFSPMLFPALAQYAQWKTMDLTKATVTQLKPDVLAINPYGVQRSYIFQEGENIAYETASIREGKGHDSYGADLTAVCVEEDRVCAVVGRVWCGAVAGADGQYTTEGKVLAMRDTIQKLRGLTALDWGGEDLYKDRLEAFMKDLMDSHPGNNVCFYFLELRPVPEKRAPDTEAPEEVPAVTQQDD
ncbi:MAG: hypothetical protein JXQ75_10655 [Phycisphaerae bacterium]|nr:hypothetical protein [Phycisphaerae bacterium]